VREIKTGQASMPDQIQPHIRLERGAGNAIVRQGLHAAIILRPSMAALSP